MTAEVPGVKLEEVAVTRDVATFSVTVDGAKLGNVSFVKYYEPVLQTIDPYVALWAGPTLCVIDRRGGTIRCIDRDDETHRLHPFEGEWIVQGELDVDLFDPASGATLAKYSHTEVIIGSSVLDGLVHIRDFAGAVITLDPHHFLEIVRSQ